MSNNSNNDNFEFNKQEPIPSEFFENANDADTIREQDRLSWCCWSCAYFHFNPRTFDHVAEAILQVFFTFFKKNP
jgi:hypothetical protein